MKLLVKIILILGAFCLIAGASAYFTITLFIKGEDTVVVPDLAGQDAVQALEMLTGLGLNTKVEGADYSSDIPKNHIIHQSPAPGDIIKKGRDIRLIISKGTKMVAVPNLKGLNLQQAEIILEENGLCTGAVSKTYLAAVKPDLIYLQSPSPGTSIERGGRIDLLISLGPRPEEYVMPELTGLFLDEAVLLLDHNKLAIGRIKTVYNPDKPANSVVSQNPPAGFLVRRKHPVDLEINRKSGHDADQSGYGFSGVRLFRYRLAPGYLKQQVRLDLKLYGETYRIYDQLIKPGKEIWVLIPAHTEAVVFLYQNDNLIKTQMYD